VRLAGSTNNASRTGADNARAFPLNAPSSMRSRPGRLCKARLRGREFLVCSTSGHAGEYSLVTGFKQATKHAAVMCTQQGGRRRKTAGQHGRFRKMPRVLSYRWARRRLRPEHCLVRNFDGNHSLISAFVPNDCWIENNVQWSDDHFQPCPLNALLRCIAQSLLTQADPHVTVCLQACNLQSTSQCTAMRPQSV
jgi:hypothetical protein